MGRKKKAGFDTLVENFKREFEQVENFHLMQEDPMGKKAFDMIAFRTADIHSYMNLVTGGFIKAANQMIVKSKQDVKRSNYGKTISINEEDYRETLYETVRVSYIGMFHKIEAYVKDAVLLAELMVKESVEEEFDIRAHLKEHFGINDIGKCWQQFHAFHVVNWVANCAKHKDGYPLKEKTPLVYANLPKNQRMRLTKDDFVKDCQTVIDFYPKFLELVICMGQHKKMQEMANDLNDFKVKLEIIRVQYLMKLALIHARPLIVG